LRENTLLRFTVPWVARPRRMARSTAWRFSTGNTPGKPRSMGLTLWLGSSP
jgi:hypothetical protein